MMGLEDVSSDAQKRPFRRDCRSAPAQESAIAQVLLGKCEGTFRLYGAIDTQQLAFRGVEFRLHGGPLGGKALGDVDNLAALLQRLLTAGAYALLFQ